MPTIHAFSSVRPTEPVRDALLAELSLAVAEATGKDEKWVMTCFVPAEGMTFGGAGGPTCYARVVSIGGFGAEQAAALVEKVTDVVERRLAVPRERTYVELSGAEAHLFGHAGRTFG